LKQCKDYNLEKRNQEKGVCVPVQAAGKVSAPLSLTCGEFDKRKFARPLT